MRKHRKIFTVIGAILLIWVIIFFIDLARCTNLNMPLFAIPLGATADDGGSGVYYGLGYTVHVKKYIDAEFGVGIRAVEMRFLGQVVAASIT